MKKLFIITACCFLFCVYLSGQDFGKAIKEKTDSLWTQTPETFRETFGSPGTYKWKSPLKRVLLYKSADSKSELSFFEHPVDKGEFSFKSNKLQSIRLTFKKPEAISSKEIYFEYASKLARQIGGLVEIGAPRLRKRKSGNDYSFTYSWRSPEYYISLRCSCSIGAKATFNPGKSKFSIFRRIPVMAADKSFETSSEEVPETGGDSKLKSDDKGDRYLETPTTPTPNNSLTR